MIAAMLLAHIVVDYVLQWDGLARWKSERLSGVVAHGGLCSEQQKPWLLSDARASSVTKRTDCCCESTGLAGIRCLAREMSIHTQ
jgi:hypothetical protein